ncbi:MAG: HK97-gp10 family putative phage morphogenesis protein [Pleomorphochaeta sp.]
MIKFKDNSQKFKTELGKVLDKGLTEAAIHAEGNCITQAPKDTGHLRGSISHITRIAQSTRETIKESIDEKTKDLAAGDFIKGVAFSGEAFVGTNLEYAPHVEYGTVIQRAQPFMRGGMDDSKAGIQSILAKNLTNLKIENKED